MQYHNHALKLLLLEYSVISFNLAKLDSQVYQSVGALEGAGGAVSLDSGLASSNRQRIDRVKSFRNYHNRFQRTRKP